MINRRLGNIHITNAPPTFSRNSPATNDDGTTVAANIPRFGVNGIKINQAMTNILVNSDFSNGATSWVLSYGTGTVSSGILSLTGNGTQPNPTVLQNVQNITAVTGHKYYQYIDAMVTDSICTKIIMNLQVNTTGSVANGMSIISPQANQWYHLSVLGTVTSYQNGYILRPMWISNYYADAATANGKVMQIKNPVCIDLTAMFGAGNEPTKAQCDALFSNYINGTQVAERLTIPNTLKSFNSSIELSIYVPSLYSFVTTILDTRDSTQTSQNNSLIVNRTATGSWYLSVGYGSGYEELTSTSQPLVASTVTGIGIRIDTFGIVTLWVNGTKILTSTHALAFTLGSAISIGSTYLATQQIDGYIQPVRVSGKARSDIEMSNTGTLAIDYFTTYYLPLTSNLTPRTF